LFAVIVFCLLSASDVYAQIDQWGYWQNGVTEAWWFSTTEFKTEEAATAVALWNAIGAAKQSPSPDWAGDYFRGSDVHGTYVRWSPQGGFIMADIDKCQAKVMRVTYGRVNATATLIEFIPEFRKGSQRHGEMHSETEPLSTIRFVPVSWRGILHLIPPDEISDFGNLAAGLGKYNPGFNPAGWLEYDFYYKLNSPESDAAGELPVVPVGYEQFVKEPLEATIESVGHRRVKRVATVGGPPYYESHSTVVIAAGSASGVKRGMVFRVRGSEGDDTVEIFKVRRTSSLGLIVRTLDDASNETYYDWDPKIGKQFPNRYPPIAVGWRVTTAPK
jgi:hypothetical protein